jgi:chromosome segregation ATPase
MKIEIHHYHHYGNLHGRINQIHEMLQRILQKEVKQDMDLKVIQDNIATLTIEVAATKDLEQSAAKAINGIAAQNETLSKELAAAIASNDPASIQAAADAIAAQTQALKDSAATLAGAIPANTTP